MTEHPLNKINFEQACKGFFPDSRFTRICTHYNLNGMCSVYKKFCDDVSNKKGGHQDATAN